MNIIIFILGVVLFIRSASRYPAGNGWEWNKKLIEVVFAIMLAPIILFTMTWVMQWVESIEGKNGSYAGVLGLMAAAVVFYFFVEWRRRVTKLDIEKGIF